MNKKVKRLLLKTVLCASFFFFLMSGSQVMATEGGLGVYPNGIEDLYVGAVPPPGAYYLNYFVYMNISDYKDIRGPGGIKLKDYGDTPSVKGWTAVEAMRLLYVTKKKIMGGDFAIHGVLPVQHLELTKATWGNMDLLANDNTHKPTGLMNAVIGSAIAWHWTKNWHGFALVDINMPTGYYAKENVMNNGTGYWTIQPVFGWSYLGDSGFQAGMKLLYDINTTNKETGYYSGQAFHTDYAVGQKFGNWIVGACGYYFVQLENDSLRNEFYDFDGNKGEAFSVGPVVEYVYKNQMFRLKAQFDTYVKNRPETRRYWFRWIYPF